MTAIDEQAELLDPVVREEIDNFEREALAFAAGGGLGDAFRPFRLLHGIYGQRQKGRQMIRVKIPHGSLTADQMDVLGDIAFLYTAGQVGHVTTRQDIQFHHVQLTDVPTVMRTLAVAGLTTREACGNVVRNVTADHFSGLCADTVFDVTPHAEMTARFFLRNPVSQALPRKFKIAFSACPHDYGLAPIHDIGATAVQRNGKRGFRLVVGGGLGAAPRVAEVFDEFVPEEEFLRTADAIIRVFDRTGNRKNKNKARLKFVIAALGIGEFRRLVTEELATLPPASEYPGPCFELQEDSATHPPAFSGGGAPPRPGFEAWRTTNARPQRQAGFSTVFVLLPIGDLTAKQFHQLADMARRYAGGRLRTANNQNVVLRWVHDQDLPYLYSDLLDAGLAEPGALTITDVMTCPGADTCSLGVTASKGLGRALRERFAAEDGILADPLVQAIRIKISGCPNSCGHHFIADLGFYGSAVHKDGRLVPAFQLLVGGRGEGDGRIARHVMKVAARRVPDAAVALLRAYLDDRAAGEPFGDWALRTGPGGIRQLLADFAEMPAFSEDPMAYVDWGATKLFSLDEMGEGECAV